MKQQLNVLVTGGAGFCGSHLVKHLLNQGHEQINQVVVVDSLAYGGSLDNLQTVDDPRYSFHQLDINHSAALLDLLHKYKIDIIYHLAAHTHVNQSLVQPETTMYHNANGTLALLEASKSYYQSLDPVAKVFFRLVNVSTDAVYGEWINQRAPALDGTAYNPTTPYAAAKAAADLLCASYRNCWGLPILTLNLCNCFGSYQFPSEIVPKTLLQALHGHEVLLAEEAVYRQWLWVGDAVSIIHETCLLWDSRHASQYNITGQLLSHQRLTELLLTALEQVLPLASNPFLKPQQLKSLSSYQDLVKPTNQVSKHEKKRWTRDFKLQTTGVNLSTTPIDQALEATAHWYLKHVSSQMHKLEQAQASLAKLEAQVKAQLKRQ